MEKVRVSNPDPETEISPVKLVPNLHISSYYAARSKAVLDKFNIKYVLTVGYHLKPISQEVEYMLLELEDDEQEFLLPNLPEALDFLERSLGNGSGVLVHCHAGISRSASIIVAYLMRRFNLSFADALASLHETHSVASPNQGFQFQLKLFGEMGCKIDEKNPDYKRMVLVDMAQKREERGKTSIRYGSLPDESKREQVVYRCKKCRKVLAGQDNVVTHQSGASSNAREWRWRSMTGSPSVSMATNHTPCTSIFIEPLQWIVGVEDGQLEGQICCPKCSSKIGSYSWVGTPCSCGSWVSPSFAMHKSKVDAMK